MKLVNKKRYCKYAGSWTNCMEPEHKTNGNCWYAIYGGSENRKKNMLAETVCPHFEPKIELSQRLQKKLLKMRDSKSNQIKRLRASIYVEKNMIGQQPYDREYVSELEDEILVLETATKKGGHYGFGE